MTDVFVSYAREDRARVEPLIEWLELAGFEVWWDTRVAPGRSFGDEIENVLGECRAVVVVWSEHSIHSNWVQAEATEGLERGILVPVHIDDVRVPLPFRRIQGAEMSGFPRNHDKRAFEQLHNVLVAMVGKPATPAPPSPRPARRLWLIVCSIAVVTIVTAVLLLPDRRPSPSNNQYYFEEFRAGPVEKTGLLLALTEEIALGVQRATGGSVTLHDARALPYGNIVSGTQVAEGLEIIVQLAGSRTKLLQRVYDLNAGLNVVQDRVIQDLAQLTGSATSLTSYPDTQAYRALLDVVADLREAPTMPRLSQARSRLTTITNQHPHFARAFAHLCSTELLMYNEAAGTEHFLAAERNCHRALTLDAEDWEVMLSLSRLYLLSGQQDKALSYVQRASQLQPGSGAVARSLGRTYLALNRHQQAIDALELALANEPNNWRNYNELGVHYFGQGDFDRAASYFRQSIEFVRDKAWSLNNVASAQYMQGNIDAAVATWQRSVTEEPTINALLNLGSAAFFEEDFINSVEYYRLAERQAPEDQRIAGHLADALNAADNENAPNAYQRAISLAHKALQIDPDNPQVHSDLAAYFAALGNVEEALLHLGRVAQHDSDIDIAYDKALVYIRVGRREDATAALERLAELGYPQHLIAADANLRYEGD